MEYELDLTYTFDSAQHIRVVIVPISPRNDYSSPRYKYYADAMKQLASINLIELPLEQGSGKNKFFNE